MIADYEYYGYPHMISNKIGEKKRKEFKLNKDTAKELYFLLECNTAYFCKNEGINFYKENFTTETLVSWNEEFVLLQLEECKKNYYTGLTIESFVKTVNMIATILNIYIKNKNVIKYIIDFLDFFIEKVGCFMFFRTYGKNIDDHTLYDLWRRILFKGNLNSNFTINNLTSISKFHNSDSEGFVPTLVYQEYYDLLNEFVKKIISKIMKKFDEKSKLMVSLNLYNGDPEDSNIEQLNFHINRLREYFKQHNISIDI